MWGRKDEPEQSEPQQAEVPRTANPERQAAAPPPVVTNSGGRANAQIGKSLKLKGEITGSEDLFIDGEIEGTVELRGNSLTVGPNGKVRADVTARAITVLGRLHGNVHAGEKIEIAKTGSLEGDISTARIVIEDGAMFRGSIDIVKPGQDRAAGGEKAAASPPPKAKEAGAKASSGAAGAKAAKSSNA